MQPIEGSESARVNRHQRMISIGVNPRVESVGNGMTVIGSGVRWHQCDPRLCRRHPRPAAADRRFRQGRFGAVALDETRPCVKLPDIAVNLSAAVGDHR